MNHMTTDAYIASYDAQTPAARGYDEYQSVKGTMQSSRDALAQQLRDLRTIPGIGRRAALSHILHAREWDKVVPKPTAAWFRRHAIECLRDATTPLPWVAAARRGERWVNPLDTETYSACGYEDGLLMAKEDAREYAPVAVAMYRTAVEEAQARKEGYRPGDILRRVEPHITF
jgi:hypothetical protein